MKELFREYRTVAVREAPAAARDICQRLKFPTLSILPRSAAAGLRHSRGPTLFLVILASLVLAGWKVGPDYRRPAVAAPTAYAHETNAALNTASAVLDEWWNVFHDPELDALIREVRAANLDLRLAQARVREARAERGVTRSELFPQVNAGSGYSRSRITFLTALEEVENALVSFGKEQNRYRSLKDSETARQRSLDLAEQQYRSGVLGFLDVLEAEQSLHAAESQRVQSEGALCSDLVRLYKSLGGGWNATRAADDGVAAAGKP